MTSESVRKIEQFLLFVNDISSANHLNAIKLRPNMKNLINR